MNIAGGDSKFLQCKIAAIQEFPRLVATLGVGDVAFEGAIDGDRTAVVA